MKIFQLLFIFLIYSGTTHSAPNEAILIIKYPHPITGGEVGRVSVNGDTPIQLDPVFGAKEIVQIIKQVKAGTVTVETSHWRRDNTNYINKFDVAPGKTYTIVMYEMAIQIWDVLFTTMQEGLVKNQEPERNEYKNLTIKNQVISIKNN